MISHEGPLGVVDPDLCVDDADGPRPADASVTPVDRRTDLHFTCATIDEALVRRMRAKK
jgi:hypothetical protein